MPLRKERELDMIRGKMLVNRATQQELQDFLLYVSKLEELVAEADSEDFWGSNGWRYHIGIE